MNQLPCQPARGWAITSSSRSLPRGAWVSCTRRRPVSLNRIVALKMIRAGAFATDREIRLFQHEAEAIAALDHPGIVPILEVSECDGHRYYSMKLIDGQNLHDVPEAIRGPVPGNCSPRGSDCRRDSPCSSSWSAPS